MDNLNYRIGTEIKAARKRLNLSQEQLAEEIDISRESVSNIERGKTTPSLPVFIDIVQFLKLDLTRLVSTPDRRITVKRAKLEAEVLALVHDLDEKTLATWLRLGHSLKQP